MSNTNTTEMSRRNFVAASVAAGAAAIAAPTVARAATPDSAAKDASSKDAAPVAGDELKADIVIAGAGGAGMFAAVEAVEAGKSVIVVEKGKSIGMANGALAGGPFVVNSKMQQDAGIPDFRAEAFDYIMDWSHWSINAPVVKECLDLSGSTVDMFSDKFGIQTYLRPDNYGAGWDSVRIGFGTKDSGVRGEDRWLPLEQYVEGLGGQFVFDCAMKSLIVEDGEVKGINCETGDGAAITVRAEKTLVSTGGFLGSDELMMQHFGTKTNALGQTLSDGTGIQAVIDAGGVYGTQWGIAGNEFTGSNDKVTPVYDRKSAAFCCAIYGVLLTNQFGRRFANEGKYADKPLAVGGAISMVGGYYYGIVDQAYVDGLASTDAWTLNGEDSEGWPTGEMTVKGKVLEDVQASFDQGVSDGWVFKADTVEELAEAIGAPELADTVKTYNEMCAAGEDTQFHKPASFMNPIEQGPFYAMQYQPSAWVTIGGVRTNDRLQAIDSTGAAIPNLFVAGADNGCTIGAPYCGYEGTSLMTAYNCGRIAGINMAADIDAQA